MGNSTGYRFGNRLHSQPCRLMAWLALLGLMLNPVLVAAQSAGPVEHLKPGDRVRVAVPGRPELDQVVEIDALGEVQIEPVGAVKLGGLSRDEAALLLKQRLRLFYPTLDALEVTVAQTGLVRIYVLGSVSQKGVLNFSTEPNLWEVVRSLGGPLENANLRDARVIREVDGQPQVYPVDLGKVLAGETFVDFVLKDGDTLVIPAMVKGVPSTKGTEGVKVFGSVTLPTIVPIEEATPLLDVLMLAGSPTRDAKKSEIRWVHNDGIRNQATLVDLDLFLVEGDPLGNPLVYPGDTVHVEFAKPSWVRNNVPFILGSLAAVATMFLAYDSVTRDR